MSFLTGTSCATLKPPVLQEPNNYSYESNRAIGVTWNPCGSDVPFGLSTGWMGTDGTNIIFARARGSLLKFTGNEWVEQPFIEGHYGRSLWTDGEHLYSSEGSDHWVFNAETEEWEKKIWNGFTDFPEQDGSARYIWTDGTEIYYSYDDRGICLQYVLNKSTDTWEEKTWNIALNAYDVWTDGVNIYYSNGSAQYVLNKETGEWEEKVWEGLTSFSGSNVWKCGSFILHSSNGTHHWSALPVTGEWNTILMDRMPIAFSGYEVWTDGNFIYITHGTHGKGEHYMLIPYGSTLYSKGEQGWHRVFSHT